MVLRLLVYQRKKVFNTYIDLYKNTCQHLQLVGSLNMFLEFSSIVKHLFIRLLKPFRFLSTSCCFTQGRNTTTKRVLKKNHAYQPHMKYIQPLRGCL